MALIASYKTTMAQTKGKKMLSAEVEASLYNTLDDMAREWSKAIGEPVSRSEVIRLLLRAGTRDPKAAFEHFADLRLREAQQRAAAAEAQLLRLRGAVEGPETLNPALASERRVDESGGDGIRTRDTVSRILV